MTIEEKAKAYDEALERAKISLDDKTISNIAIAYIKDIFPELAESEDEKVRKVLVGFFKSYKEQGTCGAETFNGIPTDKILAWLEKQGEQKPKWKQSDNIRFSQLYDFLVNKTPRLQVDCNEYAAWLNSLKQRMQ